MLISHFFILIFSCLSGDAGSSQCVISARLYTGVPRPGHCQRQRTDANIFSTWQKMINVLFLPLHMQWVTLCLCHKLDKDLWKDYNSLPKREREREREQPFPRASWDVSLYESQYAVVHERMTWDIQMQLTSLPQMPNPCPALPHSSYWNVIGIVYM